MLNSERNTATMKRKIRSAASAKFGRQTRNRVFQTVFEHGQWWLIIHTPTMLHTYSVVDADTDSGFDFEECS